MSENNPYDNKRRSENTENQEMGNTDTDEGLMKSKAATRNEGDKEEEEEEGK